MTYIETNPYGAVQHTANGVTTNSKAKSVNINLENNKDKEEEMDR